MNKGTFKSQDKLGEGASCRDYACPYMSTSVCVRVKFGMNNNTSALSSEFLHMIYKLM